MKVYLSLALALIVAIALYEFVIEPYVFKNQ